MNDVLNECVLSSVENMGSPRRNLVPQEIWSRIAGATP